MPVAKFNCDGCSEVVEYETNNGMSGEKPPKDNKCVSCGGNLKKEFGFPKGTKFSETDVPGGFDSTQGKRAWKKNLSQTEQSKVLSGERNPY